jgi:hypothetical protein
MSTWASRKRVELTAKLDGIGAELAIWRDLSRPGAELEKQHTQILRLSRMIEEMTPLVRERIASVAGIADTWTRTENMVLQLHRIWDFFRDKLALRQVDVFREYLDLADEFAWACYQPARERGSGAHNVAPEKVREPPLVFLSGVTTPFAISRGASYEREVGRVRDFRELVQKLPIPVVGVPWFQLRHLPDALVIAHEVGHLVEDDFGLTPTLERLLAETGAGEEIWGGWLGEVFADIYGTLAAGPAFAQALTDFAAVSTVHSAPGYPPVDIRVRIVLRALAETGFPHEAADLLERWAAHAPHIDTVDAELPAVVAALVAGPYPEFDGAALSDVIGFSPLHNATEGGARDLLANLTPEVHDIRALLAAAGRAFALDPHTYTERDTTRRVVKRARDIRHSGPRFTGSTPQVAEHDRTAAGEVFALLDRLCE